MEYSSDEEQLLPREHSGSEVSQITYIIYSLFFIRCLKFQRQVDLTKGRLAPGNTS